MESLGIVGAGYAPDAYAKETAMRSAIAPTLKQRLEAQVQDCQSRLADAVRAREILNANPELEELLNIMQKGRF